MLGTGRQAAGGCWGVFRRTGGDEVTEVSRCGRDPGAVPSDITGTLALPPRKRGPCVVLSRRSEAPAAAGWRAFSLGDTSQEAPKGSGERWSPAVQVKALQTGRILDLF